MTECRAGGSAPGSDGADPGRLDADMTGAGVESAPQRGTAASTGDLSNHVTDPRLGEAPTAAARDSDATQVDRDQTQVSTCVQSSPPAPAESTSRRPSMRGSRRFTVTKLIESGLSAKPPSSPPPLFRPPTDIVPSSAAAADSAGDSVEPDGWDYGPATDTTAATAASTSGTAVPGSLSGSATPSCRCSELPPPAALPTGRGGVSPFAAPALLAGLPAGVRPAPGAPAGHYATLQPGLGGVPPGADYHQPPRQPLLATGHSATLAAGLAGSARLQQAVQSRLLADSVHPRLQPSHPLYRQLAAADYNPSHTISYGHSDGRQLTVRRLLDWELPDLHTVRKYTSDVESESDADSVLSVVPTHRSSRGRTTWTNKVEFILACLGYAVGLGNLWRFPYLCYKSGGGAFFIPYLIMMVVCSIPLLLMELTIGQFTRQGPVGAMGRLCPLLKGAGLAPVVISFIFCTYYNVVIAWALYYLFSSFSGELPWASCDNEWNTPSCDDSNSNRTLAEGAANLTMGLAGDGGVLFGNGSSGLIGNGSSTVLGNGSVVVGGGSAFGDALGKTASPATTPAEQYFSLRVLEISGGVSDLGTVRIPLMLTLLLAWVLVYFSIWKSIRSSGKVVYVTVIAPYLLLFAFLWRALTLEGASTGIRYLFQPHWKLLADSKVWVNALAQNFNSVGIGFGSMITFASYNKFENRTILLDTMVIILANMLTSVFAGIIVFATLGNIAMELDRDIQKVVVDGPGLVYVVYPKALASMPFPQLWSVLFFFMLLCLGLDSQFATLEVVITSLQDGYDSLVQRYLKRHELLVLVICLVSFGLGLPYVTQGGMYVFQLMDYNVTNTSLILLALFEVGAVAWVYGTDRLGQDFLTMTRKQLSNYFIVCLKFLAPLLILAIWAFSLIDPDPLTYGPYDYPVWAYRLGWLLVALPVLPIPVCAALTLWRAPGDTLTERLKASVQPDRRIRREPGFEPTVDDPYSHGEHPRLCYEMSPLSAQIPYSAVNGDADSK